MENLTPRQKRRQKHTDKNKIKETKIFSNYLLYITYDGTRFGGMARQRFSNTIEEILNDIIDEFLNEHVKLIYSSRTDAKVHAITQSISFKTSESFKINTFLNYVNEHLPQEIYCLSLEKVSSDFHARFDVINKTYIYKIHTARDIFLNNYSYFWDNSNIDVKKINAICSLFVGERDFVGFASKKRDSDQTIRTVNFFNFKKIDNEHYIFEINADGFLYNMIRIIVGSIIMWHDNNINLDEIKTIVDSKDRSLASGKIAASGLYLKEINY